MPPSQKICETHKTTFDLIGNNKQCELNCLICCDCLKTLENKHKYEGINHKTISIIQLRSQFQKIRGFSSHQVKRCQEKLEAYMRRFVDWIAKEVQKQRKRLQRLLDNIMLTEISRQEEYELDVLEKLLQQEFENLKCKDVGTITKKLFSFVPKRVSPGYNKFVEYVEGRDQQMETEVNQLLKNTNYEAIVMKNAQTGIRYPQFDSQPLVEPPRPPPLPVVEPPSPKKTPRRSLRKQERAPSPPLQPQKSLLDIKDFHVKIKKPLEFRGSQIIKTKEQAAFIEKMFPIKVYDAKRLYRASDNNFSVKRFHQYCDGQANTIVLVKTQFNKIIGGFTPIPWKSTNNTIHTDIKKQSFLFSVTLKQKMPLIDEKTAIFNSSNFGPTFGSGADLAICHNANVEKTSYSQFPYSYANSRYIQRNQHSTFLFTGQQTGSHFVIKQWEVWKLEFND